MLYGKKWVLMSFSKNVRVQKLQNKNKMMSLGLLKSNEVRKEPLLGSYWFTEATTEEREEKIKQYYKERDQLIKKGYKVVE